MGLLSNKFSKRSKFIEDFNQSFRSVFFGGTTSGTTVNEKTALSLTSVWAAVNFYACVLGSLPLNLYIKTNNGKEKAVDVPLYDVLHSMANPEMTAMVYRENIIISILMCGISYSEIVRNGAGEIVQLWPIPFHRVEEKRNKKKEKEFVVSLPDGGTVTLSQYDCLDITGALNGACILNILKESLGLSISLNEFASQFFGNGANMGAVVSHPKTLSPDAHNNLEKSLMNEHSGLGKSHRLLLLDEDMKINTVGTDPEKSQALESRIFQINEVARIFNLPPHILREMTKSTNNNIEHQGLETVIYSLNPVCVRFEQHFDIKLLTKDQRKQYFTKHMLQGLMRGDSAARSEFYWKMFQMGAYSINDILSLEDKNTIGPEGDRRFVMANMAPIDLIDQVYTDDGRSMISHIFSGKAETKFLPPPSISKNNNTNNIRKNMEPLFTDIIQRVVNKETKAINKIAKTSQGFRNRIADFYEKMPEYIIDSIDPTARAYEELTGEKINTKEFAEKYSLDSASELINLNVEEIKERMVKWNAKKAVEKTELIIN